MLGHEFEDTELLQALIRSGTLSVIKPTTVRDLLSQIFMQLGYRQLTRIGTSSTPDLRTSGTRNSGMEKQDFVRSNLERFDEIVGRSTMPIFVSMDLFRCESGAEFLSQQSSSELYLARAPIILSISEPIFERRRQGDSSRPVRQFPYGAFPYPPCFAPSIQEGLARGLAALSDHSKSLKQADGNSERHESRQKEWECERLLEHGSLSGDEARLYLSKRAQMIARQCQLLRSDEIQGLQRVETVQCVEENYMHNTTYREACLEVGQNLVSFSWKSGASDELLKVLKWIYRQ